MKRDLYGLVALFMVLVVVVGCTPKPTSVPTVPTAWAPAPVAVAAPIPPPEDDAWAKVVAAAKKEGTVMAYIAPGFERTVAQAFQDRYGIQVETMVGTSRIQLERMKVEQAMKKPIADVFQTGLSSMVEALNVGLLNNVSQELPILRERDDFAQWPVYSPGGEIIGINLSTTTPLINTKLVKPGEEPSSYFDFLEPKWKGKILIEDPRGGGGSGFAWFASMRHLEILNDDYWRRLGPQMVFWGGASVPLVQTLARGEYWLSPAVASTNVASSIVEGAPLKMLEMKEGATTVMQSNVQ